MAGLARADGRAGSVEWSDGRKIDGAISLSPGKDLRIFTKDGQSTLQLDEVKEMRFKPEKEEIDEGFYFPTPGQATQAKTGDVYPVRYLQTEITLANGQVIDGHLFTTTLYVENDDGTEKVVLLAKQTGADGQKLADLTYPTDIRFDAGTPTAGSSQIDLTQANFPGMQSPIIIARPDLTLPPAQQTEGKPIWTVASGDPGQLLFAVQAGDGIHVAWPSDAAPGPQVDPDIQQAVEASIKILPEFYDTRTLLGCFANGNDAYSLVMMKRLGASYALAADKTPWSLVILRWKYDPEEKKATLLNRIALATGRAEGNSSPPAVLKDAGLLRDITALPAPAPEGTHP